MNSDCEHCGKDVNEGTVPLGVYTLRDEQYMMFCSFGCLAQWAVEKVGGTA